MKGGVRSGSYLCSKDSTFLSRNSRLCTNLVFALLASSSLQEQQKNLRKKWSANLRTKTYKIRKFCMAIFLRFHNISAMKLYLFSSCTISWSFCSIVLRNPSPFRSLWFSWKFKFSSLVSTSISWFILENKKIPGNFTHIPREIGRLECRLHVYKYGCPTAQSWEEASTNLRSSSFILLSLSRMASECFLSSSLAADINSAALHQGKVEGI